MDELLRLTNRHGLPAPAIEERRGRYIGYFENAFGEQLVFVCDDSEPDATLFHGDVDSEPRRVSDASGLPNVGDLILNGEERAFVCSCWIATAWPRELFSPPFGGVVAYEQCRRTVTAAVHRRFRVRLR
jgi:hypothetical protein